MLLPEYIGQLSQIRTGETRRLLLSRMTILYVMKQACRACGDTGLAVNNAAAMSEIGLACLMANDLLLPFVPQPSDNTLRRLANILPFWDYVSADQYSIEIARSRKMFVESTRLSSRGNYMDLALKFETAMGISHSTFSQLVFGCATKFLGAAAADLSSPELCILRNTFFQKSATTLESTTQFFNKVAITESELASTIRNSRNRPGDDFTCFQAYPLVEISAGLFTCIDVGFLVEKAGRGLYWTLFSELPAEDKSRIASFWGAVFEDYVNAIVSQSYGAGGTFVPTPKFANGDEAFDAYLVEGSSLVVFEHKSSVIRADAKYGGDVDKLETELQLKFVEGESDSIKGLAQLRKSVSRFLRGESVGKLTNRDIKTIYPVLICLDNTVSVPYIGRYFNEQFRLSFPRKEFRRYVVAPLYTLNISDVENLLGYLRKVKLSDILDSYYSKNRSTFLPLSRSEVPILQRIQPDSNAVIEEFERFARAMELDLFPDEARQ